MIHCSEQQGMCIAGKQTQGLAPASQALYHWAVSPAHSNFQSYFSLSYSTVCLLEPMMRQLFEFGGVIVGKVFMLRTHVFTI